MDRPATSPASIPTDYDLQVERVFQSRDAWVLALALVTLDPTLQVGMIIDGRGRWSHVFAYDPSEKVCIDVTGRRSRVDMEAGGGSQPWSTWHFMPASSTRSVFAGVKREHPEVPVSEGIRVAVANGAFSPSL